MIHEPGNRNDLSDLSEPRPGHRVTAACDLPSETHSKVVVGCGSTGEILRTPAFFSTTYSIKFLVHGTEITLHRINRHEFRIIGNESQAVPPTFPPSRRYPQPQRVKQPEPPVGKGGAEVAEESGHSPSDTDNPT